MIYLSDKHSINYREFKITQVDIMNRDMALHHFYDLLKFFLPNQKLLKYYRNFFHKNKNYQKVLFLQ
jgi:hypothetical protein